MSDADDTDMTEGDVDQAMASGTPVEIGSITDPEYLLQLYTHAIAKHDCDYLCTDMPTDDHPQWRVWRSQSQAVLKVRDRYLDQLRQRLELVAKGLDGPPPADYAGAWTELTGYVQGTVDDGGIINPVEFADYLRELKRKANAPTRAWLDQMMLRQRDAATVDPAVCPRCKGGNSEAFELCTNCHDKEQR